MLFEKDLIFASSEEERHQGQLWFNDEISQQNTSTDLRARCTRLQHEKQKRCPELLHIVVRSAAAGVELYFSISQRLKVEFFRTLGNTGVVTVSKDYSNVVNNPYVFRTLSIQKI